MAKIDRKAAAAAIDAFLRAIGRDPSSDGELTTTGERVTEAFVDDLCTGYAVDTKRLLAESVIDARAPTRSATALVVVRDVPVVTTCPHHLLVATGTATVAIEPKSRIVGLGTIAAVVDAHARRLTLQERIGEAVVADIHEVLAPHWVGIRLVLAHGCMIARGERAIGARVETVAMRGTPPPDPMRALGLGAGP